MDKLDRNQNTVIEPLISSIISKGATIDLTDIVKILKQQGGN